MTLFNNLMPVFNEIFGAANHVTVQAHGEWCQPIQAQKKLCPVCQDRKPLYDFEDAELVCSSCDADGTWHGDIFEDAGGHLHNLK